MVSHQAPTPPAVQAASPIALCTPSAPHIPTVSPQAAAEPSHPLTQTLSSPTLRKVRPNKGPISGGDEVALIGSGFSQAQDLLVQFGRGAKPVRAVFDTEHTLDCILPRSDSAGLVSVTLLLRQDRSEVQNENDVEFMYEDVDKELSVLSQLCFCGANPLLSRTSLFSRILDHRRVKTSAFNYNSSENSYTASFSLHTTASTQSQSPSTTQTTATPPSQGETLSSDSGQQITEDDLLRLLGSISWPLEDCDSINLVNNCGQNLAHYCAQLRYHRLLTAVIERGVDIHAKDVNGWTPLGVARLHRDEDAIDILEGEWEDKIQDAISTAPSSIALLRRFIPMLRSPAPPQPTVSISHKSGYSGRYSYGRGMDEFHPFGPPTPVEVAAARALCIQRYPNSILALIFRHWHDIWLTHLVHCIKRGTIHYGFKVPFVLQAVCRRWRDITRSTPRLWADLFVNCGASNHRLLRRLDIIIERSRSAPLAVYIQHIHTGIFGQRWFKDLVTVLNPTTIRWVRLTMSFSHANDMHELVHVWPLRCDRLQHIVLYGSIDGTPQYTVPFSFPSPGAPIRSIHLRNIVWWQSRTFVGLREIAIGPSHERLLTQNVIVSLLRGTPSIERLKLLAFERAHIPQPTHCLMKGFRLDHLHSLAASPVVLRTTLVGFDSPDILPALANVSIYFDAQDEEVTVEDNDSSRRKEDLRGVGVFLRRHFTRALKLRGLDERYSLGAVNSLVFAPMNSSQIRIMHFSDCVGHTTHFIVHALRRVPYVIPDIPPNQLGGDSMLQRRGGPTGGFVFLFPLLMTLRLTRCHDVNGTIIADALMAGRPQPLQLEVRNSEIDQYDKVLALLR